ncbi:MAG: hypothetical protein HQK50_08585 [Oligoflexia bacterium]|nr:hypothetical protein [Oligoflexia bacterium]MBF0365615.1 hypothetical protein [Oligoflexia bacterium]
MFADKRNRAIQLIGMVMITIFLVLMPWTSKAESCKELFSDFDSRIEQVQKELSSFRKQGCLIKWTKVEEGRSLSESEFKANQMIIDAKTAVLQSRKSAAFAHYKKITADVKLFDVALDDIVRDRRAGRINVAKGKMVTMQTLVRMLTTPTNPTCNSARIRIGLNAINSKLFVLKANGCQGISASELSEEIVQFLSSIKNHLALKLNESSEFFCHFSESFVPEDCSASFQMNLSKASSTNAYALQELIEKYLNYTQNMQKFSAILNSQECRGNVKNAQSEVFEKLKKNIEEINAQNAKAQASYLKNIATMQFPLPKGGLESIESYNRELTLDVIKKIFNPSGMYDVQAYYSMPNNQSEFRQLLHSDEMLTCCSQYLKKRRKKDCRPLLEGHMMSPVQWVMRYQLLMKRALEVKAGAVGPSKRCLALIGGDNLKKIEKIITKINSATKAIDKK